MIGSDETGFTQHNGEGNNLQGKRDWLWVLVSPLVTVFDIALSRSQLTAQQLMVRPLAVVTADRYGAYNWLPVEQSQVC